MLEFVEDLEIACSTLCHFGKESFLLWNNVKKKNDACLRHAFRFFRPHSATVVFLFFSALDGLFFSFFLFLCVLCVCVCLPACVHIQKDTEAGVSSVAACFFFFQRIQANAVKWVLPSSPPPPSYSPLPPRRCQRQCWATLLLILPIWTSMRKPNRIFCLSR